MQHILLYFFDKSNIQDFVWLGFFIFFFQVFSVKLSLFAYARTLSLCNPQPAPRRVALLQQKLW